MSVGNTYMLVSVSFPQDFQGPIDHSDLRLQSVEALGLDSKVRFTFKNSPKLNDIFEREFCDEIIQQVLKFEKVGSVLTMPDHLFISDKLILGKLSVFGSDRENEYTLVTLRWSHLLGNAFSVIKVGPEFLLSHGAPQARLAFDVLECILEPVFEMTKPSKAAHGRVDRTDRALNLLTNLEAKRDELEKYSKLLKIYLEHLIAIDTTDKTGPFSLDTDTIRKRRYLC